MYLYIYFKTFYCFLFLLSDSIYVTLYIASLLIVNCNLFVVHILSIYNILFCCDENKCLDQEQLHTYILI